LNVARQYITPATSDPVSGVISELDESILRTLAYSDLFDYPLTAAEIWRYQAGTTYSADEVTGALHRHPLLRWKVSRRGGYYCLRGRETVFDTRAQRSAASLPVWRRARLYARIVSRLPFVRMVAVTGALAMDNLGDRPDIDFMIVTEPCRVWICRRLIVAIVRLARLAGDDLCPNYIIAQSALEIDQRDLFTAHELAQMVPLYGPRVYSTIMERNSWAGEYLPVAFQQPREAPMARRRGPFARLSERVLRAATLDSWERWEMKRLRGMLRPLIGEDAEVVCSPEQCKGHTGRHRHWITTRYEQRLADLGLSSPNR
jgi:hypothetical protein